MMPEPEDLQQLSIFLHLRIVMKKKTFRITVEDYLLAQRKASREEEIAAFLERMKALGFDKQNVIKLIEER